MIVLALGLPVSVNDKCPFPDVPVGSDPSDPLYADHYIAVAASHGIVSGYDNGRFGPWDAITRSQLVRMIVRGAAAVGKPFPPYTGHAKVFADVAPSNSLYPDVMAAYQAGILSGSEGSDGRLYFLPWSSATRDHVAKMTANLVHYLEGSGS